MAILQRRIFLQLRVFEALLWVGFYLLQAVGFSLLHKFTPGPGAKLGWPDHTLFILSKLLVNIVFYLPCWWVFFYALRRVPLKIKAIIHLLFAPVFGIAWTLTFQPFMYWISHMKYHSPSFLWDCYTTAIHYILTFSLMHAYNYWLESKRRLQKAQELKDLAHASEINALKSQIEPHFLFNTLNSISASVPSSLENTRVLIAQLADTFRYALQVSETQWITLNEEVQFLQTWLALEEHRFGKRLHVIYKIDEECLRHKIPPMLLQPIVENSLKHGLSEKLEGGKIIIECRLDRDAVAIAISDTGAGYNGELERMFNKGIGLNNICRRLQLQFNETLHVERGEEGLRFTFRVPATPALSNKMALNTVS